MRNLPVIKIIWVMIQGLFLPLVLWLDELRGCGNYLLAIGVFVLLEILYLGDTLLFLKIFKTKE
jgi:hypothetical protein